jgi:diguanylate cyclase (GGDEF)-like protein
MMGGFRGWHRLRLRVGGKFFLVVAVLVASLLGTAAIGAVAQAKMKTEAEKLYTGSILGMERLAALTTSVTDAGWTALQMIPTTDPGRLAELNAQLYNEIVPRADRQVSALQQSAHTPEEQAGGNHVSASWHGFKKVIASEAFAATARGRTDEQFNDRLADQVVAVLSEMRGAMNGLQATMAAQAGTARTHIEEQYRSSLWQVAVIIAGALILGVGSVLLLIRNIVPRIRKYSAFAADVAAGQLSVRLEPGGSDELSDLGRALDQMVDRRAAEHRYDSTQAEFSAALQGTEAEDEAHQLLKRHLERSIPGSTAIVLNRNNSANRLQPTTALPETGPLAERLSGAAPRACLAVRFARPHDENDGCERLLPCPVCSSASSRCQPLLVGGEVIGAVLVQHPDLKEDDQRRIGESVMHAAPVLANLRNLAIAEHRALTDALTGLPNQRASHDVILRMVAQAGRSLNPLAVVLLDLDHFKKINDTYGHDKGDEVLASVGATLTAGLRASDFAGRYGGEEFLLLLPETDAEGARTILERLRLAIAAITISVVDLHVTASFGVAVLPDHAVDASTLIRQADRALYAAKAGGRNRVEVVTDAPGGTGAPGLELRSADRDDAVEVPSPTK